MKTSDFTYHLPAELIAQQPAPDRTGARMMIVCRNTGSLERRRVADLPEFLRPGDVLVINDTRVIPARLFGRKEKTGGRVEVLLIEELTDDLIRPDKLSPCRNNSSMKICCSGRSQERHAVLQTTATPAGPVMVSLWEALVKASRSPETGSFLELASGQIQAEVLARIGNGRALLRLIHDRPLMKILDQEGVPPLPPYIKRPHAVAHRDQIAVDRDRYQTVYARVPGAIAAPTAGLHFTPDLLECLSRQGVGQASVTLHVGPGTFKPVSSDIVEDHRMEPERYSVSPETARCITEAQQRQSRIVAVGSTVVRTLETVAAEHGAVTPAEGRSRLFIYPPYSFRVVQAMLTNFHLPASTLLMMVSAFAGRDLIRHAYETAIRERYRFYSYGDCMLIL
ncbi:MAG: tRNA preQ1(34) S-adenosylmethionine ribosyltransferase-isomerase QueA [Verrucomicrobia bacterium]|nr:tRNA preQ1(34) S-adenosylmethionine ribosyltransferase-isomerase QueA [Verrucomicrobiota bacterium]MBU4290187.1 tRNA preQ1(34) S-adenosylmethionine ribosyltransferase-isomerase QueA [Verrucomicrobiota bacterium]MBU4430186.1 tRNA preQ1(34) S-adenosylmethionine ribosyltransferase-isomerase QueA [Verrucomicrobiota bacterium]MBU4497933.1 tRNA preQ1(34) S-adenosylmethionine ribosyltransferase-isomerase QueA [Verrucomicrobiota bacterium]MCG2681699.1 tRNA preQ1(34) S-adenosylmethionine ribosyltrans